MQLDKIVETTFLPPPTARESGFGADFEYMINFDNIRDKFFPCFQETNSGNSYNITESGEKAYSYSKDKTFFRSRKSAKQLCWKYFRYNYNRREFIPKVEINNAT